MTWADLNERQQAYMQAIYEVDQETEKWEKGAWNRGERARPTIEWRWMYYGVMPETGTDSPLRARLKAAKLVDAGTGSTFEALESRKYILVQYRPVALGVMQTYLQITPTGRRLVRESTGQQREKSLPAGTLREWHWKAIVEAWKARPEGVKQDVSGYYGRIGWNTWLRLRDYKPGALVKEHHTFGQYNEATASTRIDYWIRLTPAGEQFYREHWQYYQDLYPDVAAANPLETDK